MALLTRDEYIAQLRPDGSSSTDTCPICHEDVDSPVTTSCRHTFCLECLKPWMERSHTCPSCRNALYEKPPTEDEAEDDGESSGADMDESDEEPDLYTSPIWYPALDDRDTDWILDNFDGNKEYVATHITRPGSLNDRPIREPHGYANAFLYLHTESQLADEAIAALLSVQPFVLAPGALFSDSQIGTNKISAEISGSSLLRLSNPDCRVCVAASSA
ncbi:putative RING finger protein [Pseudocercospora fuligena]|uniref:Putative RING finger protein n=1 Tax=Pseudocercospora fuligena TaxID=685502 RepID=A0A8H6RCT2_9PEZI|nr:putative RING finger protein [Pseudocercospora fuligena]